ncbi:hypothetical protein C8Q80DRAFT_1265537 [Daedaleopsis nitida]|nr:hypothetical protein C8Q80DRAFT_1265537 [Daedaleopsis nitida]
MLALTSLFLSLALSAASSAIPAKRQGTDFAWCNALRNNCDHLMVNSTDFSDFFTHDACLFGSTCPPDTLGPDDGPLPSRRNVQLFIHQVGIDVHGTGFEAPESEDLRVPTSLLQTISTNGNTITEANFLDGFYRVLDETHGPYPTSPDVVKDYFSYIVDWTAVCSGDIPFQNFADYFVYQSFVKSSGNC